MLLITSFFQMLGQVDRLSTFAEYQLAEAVLNGMSLKIDNGNDCLVLTLHQWQLLSRRAILITCKPGAIALSSGPPNGILEIDQVEWCTIL